MDNKMISWLNYSVSDKEGEACSVLQPGASSQGGWTESELTETGIYMRDLLRSYPDEPVITLAPGPTHHLVTTGMYNGIIQVQYKLSALQYVAFSLFDVNGSLLWNRQIGMKGAGNHSESIFTENLPNNIYMVNVSIGGASHTNQVFLMR